MARLPTERTLALQRELEKHVGRENLATVDELTDLTGKDGQELKLTRKQVYQRIPTLRRRFRKGINSDSEDVENPHELVNAKYGKGDKFMRGYFLTRNNFGRDWVDPGELTAKDIIGRFRNFKEFMKIAKPHIRKWKKEHTSAYKKIVHEVIEALIWD